MTDKSVDTFKSAFSKPAAVVKAPNKRQIVDNKEVVKTAREKELEDALARLNKMLEDGKKEVLPKSTELSEEDQKIAQLKRDIELQKIENEKKRVQMEIASLSNPTSSTAQSVVSNNVAKSTGFTSRSTNQAISSARQSSASRGPASVKATSSGASVSAPQAISSSSTLAAESSRGQASDSLTSSNKSASSSSDSSSFSLSATSIGDISLSKDLNQQDINNSRLVKVGFNIDSIPPADREDFFKSLFIEGEESILIELPDGEKLLVESKENDSKDEINPKEESNEEIKRTKERMKYEDLKEYLKVGATEDY
jgi:hypothetical protein